MFKLWPLITCCRVWWDIHFLLEMGNPNQCTGLESWNLVTGLLLKWSGHTFCYFYSLFVVNVAKFPHCMSGWMSTFLWGLYCPVTLISLLIKMRTVILLIHNDTPMFIAWHCDIQVMLRNKPILDLMFAFLLVAYSLSRCGFCKWMFVKYIYNFFSYLSSPCFCFPLISGSYILLKQGL